jgi:dipeptide/tripeptide permease
MIGYWIGFGICALLVLMGLLMLWRCRQWTYGMGSAAREGYLFASLCLIAGGVLVALTLGIAAFQAAHGADPFAG